MLPDSINAWEGLLSTRPEKINNSSIHVMTVSEILVAVDLDAIPGA